MNKIILVTYYFPPDPSIGSRRWAKFAKYLSQLGYEVEVICVDTSGKNSPWDQDVKNVTVHKLPYRYFRILDKQPKNVLQKLMYRLALAFLKMVIKGTVYDRAIFLKKPYQQKISELLKDNSCLAVIANGPPHRVMYYSMELKEKFPDVVFVADFRDPWMDWYNLGYPSLNEKNKGAELKMESCVVNNADVITCPVPVMKEELAARYPEIGSKVHVLPHAFDEDEFKYEINKNIHTGQSIKKVAYFGAKYKAADNEWASTIDFFSSVNDTFQLDLFLTDFEDKSSRNLPVNIRINDPLSSDKLFMSLSVYDFLILVYPRGFKDYFASKFYEMVRTGVPLLYFGYKGKTAEFIMNSGIGIFIDLDDFNKKDYQAARNQLLNFKPEDNINVEEYSFLYQAKVLADMIKQVKK